MESPELTIASAAAVKSVEPLQVAEMGRLLGVDSEAVVSAPSGPSDRERIVAVIKKAGLPVSGIKLDVKSVVDAMAYDKKVASGKLRFVLLDRIGRAVIRDDVPIDLVTKAVESLR